MPFLVEEAGAKRPFEMVVDQLSVGEVIMSPASKTSEAASRWRHADL